MTDDEIAGSISEEKGLRIDHAAMVECIREGKLIHQNQAAELKIIFYMPIQIFDETICAIVEIDTGLTQRLLKQNRMKILGAVTLILMISLFLGGWLALYLIKPLRELQIKAQATKKKLSGSVLRIDRENEIQSLVLAFNVMTDTVKEHLSRRKRAKIRPKELLESLSKSKERFRDIAESTSDLICEVDKNGVYTYISEKVEGLLGYSTTEVIGKTSFDFMHPDEKERIGAIFIEEAKKNVRYVTWEIGILLKTVTGHFIC